MCKSTDMGNDFQSYFIMSQHEEILSVRGMCLEKSSKGKRGGVPGMVQKEDSERQSKEKGVKVQEGDQKRGLSGVGQKSLDS